MRARHHGMAAVTPGAAVVAVAAAVAAALAAAGPATAQAGYGGARISVTRVAGRTALLGGGPLLAVTADRITAGVLLTPSEGDAGGLQLVGVGPFVEYDLTPEGRLHVLPAIQLATGAVVYDGAARSTAAMVGVEPRIAVTTGGRSTRFELSVGWRLAWATAELGDLGTRTLGGPVVSFGIRDGVFHGPESEAAGSEATGSEATGPEATGAGATGVRRRPRGGWFLASMFSTRVTRFAGETVHLDGGGTRVDLGRWAVGFGGFVTRDWLRAAELPVAGGWGGLVAEYRFQIDGPLDPWVGLLVGGGGLGRRIGATEEYETAGMFVVESTVGAAVPVASFLRAALRLGYRASVCGACIPGVENRDVSGVSAGIDLRFGDFR